ncbi:TPA: phage terminase large subunit [Clostridium botulinum]|uniref:phage terminase large subunit n=1 Tax=Clostridium botulinum TaxID=1491 RepID=UPI001C9B5E45|nr:phage terminase large subunit [Clostridium botulinum]MBY6909520.1 phage terminase large subunit [Clostridium botulinum]
MEIPVEVEIRLQQLKSSLEKLVIQAKTSNLSPDDLQEYLAYAKAIKREYRILRGEYDLLYFAYEYFSDRYNEENDNNLIPNVYGIENAPDFHRELCGILDSLNEDVRQKICWSVPRGHAKSAYLSNILPVHQIVYKKRNYILIVSETEGMSRKFVEWVSDQLKFNQKLRDDFGILLHENKMANEQDNQEGFVTTNNIRVQSASIGKQLRGARHGAFRPDLVILDDLESSKNTNTKELRDKNLHWFNSVIMPIGDITKTAFIYMGTLVHGQGLLPAVLARSDFKGKIYSAIVSEPEYPELWDKLESILRDQENTDREHDAEVFYYSNKERMDKGAVTLWNDRFTYFELMKIKVNVGSRAFGSEYLNRPTDDETAIFKKNYMQFYDNKDLYYADGRPMNLEVYGFWDIAIGKNDRSDYNAIVTIGRDKRTGILYILDAWAGKVPMHKALEVAIEKIQEYGHSAFGVETVQAQYDMYRQLRERLTKLGCYKTRVLAVNPKGKKEDRIEQLEPLVEQGVIRFRQNQRLLLEMLEQFPNHDHDDLPDALASVVEIAGKQRKRTYYKKPSGF